MLSYHCPRHFVTLLSEIPNTFPAISKYQPQDATTNPTLILVASQKAEYAKLVDAAVEYGKSHVSISRETTIDIDQQFAGAGY